MRHHLSAAAVAAIVAAGITLFLPRLATQPAHEPVATAQQQESAYDRVMRTGEIRCGYVSASLPFFARDPNTGAFYGIWYHYLEELGKALNLKIVWQQEAVFATYIEDLNSGRYDIECFGGWPNANRGKRMEYTLPVFFTPLYLYTKAGNTAFDGQYDRVNSPDVRISTIDGTTADRLRLSRFPRTTLVSLPESADYASMLLNLVTGKADVAIFDYDLFLNFDRQNPGLLRRVNGSPLRVMADCLGLPAGEFRLQQMLNVATQELLYDGVIDRILDKYEQIPGTYLRVPPPYALPKD